MDLPGIEHTCPADAVIADMRSDGRLAWISGKWLLGFDLSKPVPPSRVEFHYTYVPFAARDMPGSEGFRPAAGR
jgi:hypothetical protein